MSPKTYLQQDRQLGDPLFIDGKDAYLRYNADLVNFNDSADPVDFSIDYQQSPGKNRLIILSSNLPVRTLQVQCYVGGKNSDQASSNLSALAADCRDCVIKRGGSKFEYAAVLMDYTDEDSGVPPYRLATLTFAAIRRYPLVSVSLSGSGEVYNPGTCPSGMRLDVTPFAAFEAFIINGVTCKSLAAGKTFTIDGLEGQVICEGINRFADTDLSEFPKITPGRNSIEMSFPAEVKVSFYPIL
ncbi:MAG: hypothetical protein HFE39_09675 [Clostridiales bacterium]|nr:hypothetical protein [Clostridiales bacterium]